MSRIEAESLEMRGVVLGGGRGTRLQPLTNETHKHLLPVGDKPLIFYPIEQLVQSGVQDILLLIDQRYASQFMDVLRDGSDLGVRSLAYIWQSPDGKGIPSAINQVRHFAESGKIVVACGDVIIENGISKPVHDFREQQRGARMTSVHEWDSAGYSPLVTSGDMVMGIKPKDKERHEPALIDLGVYMYGSDVFDRIDKLIPSERGETEIWDLQETYMKEDQLRFTVVDGWWSDVGGSLEHYREADLRYLPKE